MSEPAALGNSPAPTWRTWLVLATVALMPLSFNLGAWLYDVLPGPLFQALPQGLQRTIAKRNPFYFSPLDLLVLPLFGLAIWDCLKGRMRSWAPPPANAVWVALALLSLLWVSGGSRWDWFKSGVLQTALIGLAAVWVFRHLAAAPAGGRRLALVLGGSVSLCLLYALYQYVQPPGLPLPSGETGRVYGGGVTDVRLGGWYEYRGQLAAQIAMAVPAAVAFAALDPNATVRIAALALAAVGLCVCMSGGGVAAACAGVLAVAGALALGNRRAKPAGGARIAGLIFAGLLFIVLVVLPRLPRENPKALWRSVTLYAETTVKTADGRETTVERPTARTRRHQAALKFLREPGHLAKGAGAGQFQPSVNAYYTEPYPKPGRNTDDEAAFDMEADEPMTFGLLETTAVELGIAGLAALAWVFLAWASAAISAFARAAPEDALTRTLALASLGACVGALVFSLFGSPLVRGCGGSFAFFLGVALALDGDERTPAPSV